MKTVVRQEIREVLQEVYYRPAVTIFMPFEPKMNSKAEIIYSLKVATDKVEKELQENYPEEIYSLVLHKLKSIIKSLNYYTYKKSIAIYVSPVFEKVLYLDIALEEKIIIEESFEIRDLVFSKKQTHKYLVLVLSEKESRIYLGNSTIFARIVSNTPELDYADLNGLPEPKEIKLNRFLHHADNVLDIVLNAYHLPLFVIGSETITDRFKQITRHKIAVIEYLNDDHQTLTEDEIRQIVAPYINDWKNVHRKDLLNQLEEARYYNRLALGMKEVWHEAVSHNGRLLVVEKNYMYAAHTGGSDDWIYNKSGNKFSYIKDAVDDVIEMVLENGGDVEFIDKDMLTQYKKIALIKHY